MPESGANVRRLPFLSVPAWDISDEEISEWKQTPGMRLAAFTAECIRDGRYDDGREIYPPRPGSREELSRSTIDQVMAILAGRGMVRKSGDAWHAVTPGRMEPSVRRAVATLLARRADLPAALAAELDAWKLTLDALAATDTLEAAGGTPVGQAATPRAGRASQAAARGHGELMTADHDAEAIAMYRESLAWAVSAAWGLPLDRSAPVREEETRTGRRPRPPARLRAWSGGGVRSAGTFCAAGCAERMSRRIFSPPPLPRAQAAMTGGHAKQQAVQNDLDIDLDPCGCATWVRGS